MNICDFERCCGCGACMNICPNNAITMRENQYGELLPFISEDRCTSCGLCQGVCPINNELILNEAEESYAVQSRLEGDKERSSSGGVAAVLSRYIIRNGGVVYGAALINKKCKHIRIEQESEFESLRGSKYVQSQTGFIFTDVKQQLKADKRVLFIGTPCQVAGLKAFLKEDYNNLVTIDLVCHGTPPQKFLREHLNEKCVDWEGYAFRGIYDHKMTIFKDNKPVYIKNGDEDEYYSAFLKSIIHRNSCYSCNWARPQRVADITIGDFWGLDKHSLKNKLSGRISLVLPNTPKGKEFFWEARDLFIFEKRKLEEALNERQGNLHHPSKKHPEREKFLKYYSLLGFDRAIKKLDFWKENVIRQRKMKLSEISIYRFMSAIKRKLFKGHI